MSVRNQHSRRKFLQGTAAALGAGALGFPAIVPSSALGKDGAVAPSNRIVMGGIGTGGRGGNHLDTFTSMKDVQMVACCDADAGHLANGVGAVNEKYGNTDCAGFKDLNEMLANKEIDAVFVATPDHWHALSAVAAFNAGKDVYCEKPLANSIYEGRKIIEAMEKNKRILQTGSQERSGNNARYAAELVRSGGIGKLHTITVNLPDDDGHLAKLRAYQGIPKGVPVPENLDWDRWLGRAPMVDYHPDRCHFSWRFILEHGGGEMTDRGAHVIDIGQLGNGTDDTGPVEIEGKGRQIPNCLYDAFWSYTFEMKYANGVRLLGSTAKPRGVKFEGTDGWIFVHIHGQRLEASKPELLDQAAQQKKFGSQWASVGRSKKGHWGDFIEACKTRQQPLAGGEIGHRTASLCHLANIAFRLGRKLKWDPAAEQFVGDDEANKWVKPSFREPYVL
jgi:predicted dehydrogenase